MSAYIVDPRTIDYLVQWASGRRQQDLNAWMTLEQCPPDLIRAFDGHRLRLGEVTEDELGQLLLRENVRSVTTRYPNDSADDLPGPINQKRVWRYSYKPVPHAMMQPAWVVKSCDCLDYQSCETDDWRETAAYLVLQAIRESAVNALIPDDAPWGVTDTDLSPVRA